MNFFKIYLWRKIGIIYFLISTILSPIFFYLFYQTFYDYLQRESTFWNIENIKLTQNYAQKNIFIIFSILFSILWISIIAISLYWIYNFHYKKNSGNIYLKILLFIIILCIILAAILLSFQPQNQKKIIKINNSRKQIQLLGPNYKYGWVLFFIWFIAAILSLIALKNYGFFIKKDKKFCLKNKKNKFLHIFIQK
ncbi:Uncharacterised protein [Mesomycoplasma neurolyticum]|uniref:Uncharacterized protein n=1 Tax=Mesomycoplasma neurolyticum TaxID=2120 RepID=A0A449A5A9_9BACT|nr:Uncharacterised protein [Mesomycoplasma neurolyticum]